MSKNNRNNQQPRKDTPVSNQDNELTPPTVELEANDKAGGTEDAAQGDTRPEDVSTTTDNGDGTSLVQRAGASAIVDNATGEPLPVIASGDASKSTDGTTDTPVAAAADTAAPAVAASTPAPVADAPAATEVAAVVIGGQTSAVDVATSQPVPHTAANIGTLEVPKDEYELPLGASGHARVTIQELKDYIAAVTKRPRPHEQAAAGLQMGLHHTLVQLVNVDAESFEATFLLGMKIIRDNLDGAFAGENIHRYTPLMQLPPAQATAFRMLVNALVALADPNSEARAIAKRQINIEMALGNPKIKEESRQRVLAFFGYQ